MPTESVFQLQPYAIARLSGLSSNMKLPESPPHLDDMAMLRKYIVDIGRIPYINEAIEVSSETLASVIRRVSNGDTVSKKRLRKATLSIARYVSRMTGRSTPFGLMAGVAPLSFASATSVSVGEGHRKLVRPDMDWLYQVIAGIETDFAILCRLSVVENDLSYTRGDRLRLPTNSGEPNGNPPQFREVSVRKTRAVAVTMEIARQSCSFRTLQQELHKKFPEADSNSIDAMLVSLIKDGFLLTDLRPLATSTDPIKHVIDIISSEPNHPTTEGLRRVQTALQEYSSAPAGSAVREWSNAVNEMNQIHAGDRQIQVDLAMDAQLVLPTSVSNELVSAISVAWKAASLQPSADPLGDYKADFIERYGEGAFVSVKKALDHEVGIGPPFRYSMPPPQKRRADRDHPSDTARDQLLLGLAQGAAARGFEEIELDASLVSRLRGPRSDDEMATPIEVCANLVSDSLEDLDLGKFGLSLAPMSYTRMGAMFGRHLAIDSSLKAAMANSIPVEANGSRPSQVISATSGARINNVIQVPRLTEDVITVGVYQDRLSPRSYSLDDLLIGVQDGKFIVASTKSGGELTPLIFHGLNVTHLVPNATRLLIDIGEQHRIPWQPWDWGAAKNMPFLPRVRTGRTALSSARWLVSAALSDTSLNASEWDKEFDRWRACWNVPDQVYAGQSDQRILLDLTSPLHRQILRNDLRRMPMLQLQELPLGGMYDYGWADGHATEIVVPLVSPDSDRSRKISRTPSSHHVHSPTEEVYTPGSQWLSIRLYAYETLHNEILLKYLPGIVEEASQLYDTWFFLRYYDNAPHLRVRFHAKCPDSLSQLIDLTHSWSESLRAQNLIREVVVDTYRPEVSRYGGPTAIRAAEQVFCADSKSVLEQLAFLSEDYPDLPVEFLSAGNYFALAEDFCGNGWEAVLLEALPRTTFHAVFQEHRSEALRHLNLSLDRPSGLMPDGSLLAESWYRRAPYLREYSKAIRSTTTQFQEQKLLGILRSIIHMHSNRLLGLGADVEQRAYSIARGVLKAHLSRKDVTG